MPMNPRTLRPGSTFTPRSISGLALWLDAADGSSLYTTDAGPVTAVSAPTEISGCVGWWDASDASSITQSGGLVSQWNDKSGQGSHATASGTSRPTLVSNALNGRSVVSFDGADDVMEAAISSGYTAATVFVVLRADAAGGGSLGRAMTRGASTLFFDGANAALRYNPPFAGATGNGGQRTANSSVALGAWSLSSFTWSGGLDVSTAITPRLSGASSSAGLTGTGDSLSSTGISTLAIGNRSVADGNDRGWNGRIAELIFFNASLSTANIARVEAYLAAKWGISGVHKNTQDELTAVGSPTEVPGCALWLDADDASSITLSGGNVSEWRDKSGAGSPAAAQATPANRPQRVASSLNGRATIEFDDADSLVFGSSTAAFNYLHNATGATMFVVLKPDATSNPDAIRYLLNNTNNSSASTGISLFFDDRSSLLRNNRILHSVNRGVSGASTSTITTNNDFVTAANAFFVFSVVSDNANATAASRLFLYHNGTSSGVANTLTNAAATGNASQNLTIGNFGGGGASAAIAEIIFYQGVISTTDRGRVEKYLAQKWGIANVPDPTPPVGYWRDKSGNNRHATQATGGSRPTRAASMNGRASVEFAAAASSLLQSTATVANVVGSATTDPQTTVYAVMRNPPGVSGAAFGTPANVNEPRYTYFNRFDASGSYFDCPNVSTGRLVCAMPQASAESAAIHGLSRAGSAMAATYNGARMAQRLDASGAFSAATANIQIGKALGVGGGTNNAGVFSELLFYARGLTTSERQRIERYLAAKWGITLAPQVSNADAQDWVNRVYQNGGTVSSTTATAVNTFCNAIDEAGIRDRFYRLNLFCGTGLSACLVPLYRGPSFGGTQYGGTTDANNGPFVSGDYAETGASGGLTGNGTSKYLDTGLTYDAMGVPSTNHIGVFKGAGTWNTSIEIIGARDADDYYYIQGRAQVGGDHKVHAFSGPGASGGSFINNATVSSATNFLVASRNSSASFVLYQNAASVASTSSAVTIAGSNRPFLVFMREIGTGPSFIGWTHRLLGYSFGLGMSAAQVSAYNSAMQALQTSLSRNV